MAKSLEAAAGTVEQQGERFELCGGGSWGWRVRWVGRLAQLLLQAAQGLPLGILSKEPLQQLAGGVSVATVGKAAHLQHARTPACFAAALLEDFDYACFALGLADADRLTPSIEANGHLAASHGMASNNIMKPRIKQGLGRGVD
jgi:hypothetical protein